MDYYTKTTDGTFTLAVHPDTAKLAEFRANNIALKQKLATFEGIDPAEYAAMKAELATDDAADEAADAADAAAAAASLQRVTDLQSQLAAATTKLAASAALETQLAEAQKKADRGVLREKLRDKLLVAGVLPAALDIALDKAEPIFAVKDDVLIAKAGGPASVDEWILSATSDFGFLFAPSRGGGTSPKASVLGAHSAANVLRDPSPQDLGKYAADIKSGKMKIEFTN